MKKVLFVASVTKHIEAFHIPYLKWFEKQGFVVDIAANGELKIECYDKQFNIPNVRNPFNKDVLKGYKALKNIIEAGGYNIIHCHTPVASIITRLAARKSRRKGTKVVYTAHGFHFFKGAPLLNWVVYFPIEWLCSLFTDVLITINKEDYAFAQKHMHAKRICYVPGVGVDITKFKNTIIDKSIIRNNINVPDDATMLFSVGELNENKNHELIIRTMAKLKRNNIHYCVAGVGKKREYLQTLATELNLSDKVHFLGYRSDINELMKASDVFCFPSHREGLPVSLMEAMASGLPCVVSSIRGNTDLIEDGVNGYLCDATSAEGFANAINKLCGNEELRNTMKENNLEKIKMFDITNVEKNMIEIYAVLFSDT